MTTRLRTLALAAALLAPAAASAQSDILLQLRSGTVPSDRLRVDSAGGLVAIAQAGIGIIPATGTGWRLMWHPFKAAFRAGHVSGTAWDDENIGFYSWAGGSTATASGVYSFAFGEQVVASGTRAIAFGQQSVAAGTSSFAGGISASACGTGSIAMGQNATAGGSTGTTCPAVPGVGGIALGFKTTADGDNSVAIGTRASANGKDGAMVFGDLSGTVADTIKASANNEFSVRAAGGIRMRSNTALTTGCNIAAGGASWVCTSSRTMKDHFAPVSGELLLSQLRSVPVSYWNYKEEQGNVRHLGPFAEDFSAAFGLGNDDTAIGTVDIAGVNFAGVKALEARTTAQARRIETLEAQAAAQAERMAALESELAELKTLILKQAAKP